MLRPRDGRVIGGVCAALARRLELDVTLVRAAAVVLGLLGVGLVLYVVGWAAIAEEDALSTPDQESER